MNSNNPHMTSTLSKLVELLHNQEDYEAIIKSARFLQKALEMLGQEVPEAKLLDLCKKFCDKGIYVEGDLSVLHTYSAEEKIQGLNIPKINNLVPSV